MALRKSNGGFTLIELMMVIVIVAVLLLVALPAYRDQIIRGHRAAAKAEMLEIGNRQEQYLLANRAYTDTLSDIAYTVPPDVGARYNISIDTTSASTLPYFEITFTAKGSQLEDGDLTIDSEGTKLPAEKWAR